MSQTVIKHLFIIHSAITAFVVRRLIENDQLNLADCYFLSRANCTSFITNWHPHAKILISDPYYDSWPYDEGIYIPGLIKWQGDFYRDLYNFLLTGKNLHQASPQELQQAQDELTASLGTAYHLHPQLTPEQISIFAQENHADYLLTETERSSANRVYRELDWLAQLTPAQLAQLEPFPAKHPADANLDFIAYLPHTLDYVFNGIIHFPYCREIHFFEEGSVNYTCMEEVPRSDLEDYLAYITDHEYSSESYSGFKYLKHDGMYTNGLNLNLQNLNYPYTPKFYGLGADTFKYNRCEDLADAELIILAHNQPSQIEHSPFYTYQKEFFATDERVINHPVIQEYLKGDDYIGNFVNIIVIDNYTPNISEEEFWRFNQELFNRVKSLGLFFVFVKFHPRLYSGARRALGEMLTKTGFEYRVIEDDVCMEEIFMHTPENEIIVHALHSSLLLYAAKFGQVAFSYNDIYGDTPYFHKLFTEYLYDIPQIIKGFYELNNRSVTMKRD